MSDMKFRKEICKKKGMFLFEVRVIFMFLSENMYRKENLVLKIEKNCFLTKLILGLT